MSLHVNLILDNELRSGSNISRRFVVRTSAVVLVGLALLAVGALVLRSRATKQTLAFSREEQKRIDPVYQAVVRNQEALANLKKLGALLDGWNAARLPGPGYLCALREQVPEQVQLTRLTLQQSLERPPPPRAPTRRRGRGPAPPPPPAHSQWIGNVYLGGSAVGAQADANVRRMDNAFKTLPFFKDLFARVEVKRFTAGQENLAGDVRVFDIECGFQPRSIRGGG